MGNSRLTGERYFTRNGKTEFVVRERWIGEREMSRLHCRIYFHPTCFRCSAIESDRAKRVTHRLMAEEQTDGKYERTEVAR